MSRFQKTKNKKDDDDDDEVNSISPPSSSSSKPLTLEAVLPVIEHELSLTVAELVM